MTEAPKPTDGPWSVEQIEYSKGLDTSFEIRAGKKLIAQTIMAEKGEGWRDGIIATDKANMTLMAAAPEMLAALQAAIALSDKRLNPEIGRTGECQRVYDQCAAAVAKAEGPRS